jgi:hypothetical protein
MRSVMRSKQIVSLAAFLGTFAIAYSIVWLTVGVASPRFPFSGRSFSDPSARGISRLLRQDVRNGEKMAYEMAADDSFSGTDSHSVALRAETVSDYVDGASRLNGDSLPTDFSTAWNRHARAWQNYSAFLQSAADGHTSRCRLAAIEADYNREIDATWFEVLRIAADHGAEIPAGAY